jgi:VWFA-related protein
VEQQGDSVRFSRRLFFIFIACAILFAWSSPAGWASGVRQVAITWVDPAQFPQVTVYLAVTDQDAQPVTGLQPADITLAENDIPIKAVTLEAVAHPMVIGIVLDTSGSFQQREAGKTRLEHARAAAIRLVSPDYKRLAVDDHVAVFAFAAGHPKRLQDYSYDHTQVIRNGINAASTAGNVNTALFDVLRQAIEDTAGRQGVRRRALLVFSDGKDTTSGTELARVIQKAIDAHLLIYTVGLGADLAPDRPGSAFLRRLALDTGGQYLWHRPGQIGAAESLDKLLDELSRQRQGYILRYTSNEYIGRPRLRIVAARAGWTSEATTAYDVPSLPPQVSIQDIQDGDILEGIVNVRAVISRDQRPISRVEFYVDQRVVCALAAPPWLCQVDTRPYANSPTQPQKHALAVWAYDTAGYKTSDTRAIGARLPLRASLPVPLPPVPGGQVASWISILALILATISLMLFIVLAVIVRRQGWTGASNLVRRGIEHATTGMVERITGAFGSSPPKTLAIFTVISADHSGQRFVMSTPSIYLGRNPAEVGDGLIFDWDIDVSRRHAKLEYKNGRFYLWDLRSRNKTFVNNVPVAPSDGSDISKAAQLDNGAIIRLGPKLQLRFETALFSRIHPTTDPGIIHRNTDGKRSPFRITK